MTDDRASELAQQVQHAVLADIAYRIASGQVGPTNQSMPGIVWKQHIAAALRAHAEEATQEHSDALAAAFAEQLIISVEEASAHWKRETETGAAMLAEIHRGLGIVRGDTPGISAQAVLDRVARLVEEARGLEGEWHAGLNAILSTRVAVLLTALGEIRGACVVKPHRFATQAQAILAIVEPVLFDDRRSAERYAATVRARGEKG